MMMKSLPSKARCACFALMLPFFALSAPLAALASEVNVYTYREPSLIRPLFDRFTTETGVKVNVIFANAGLEERIQSEGARGPADLLITVGIARLSKAVELGITQPLNSPVIQKAVPAQLQGENGQWVALTTRARVIYAHKTRVKDQAITYEDLADPRWRGKICIRDGQHEYNNALFAAMVSHKGAERAETWIKGLRDNLAKRPSGGDRDVAKDIASGLCDIGLANTYYYGLMAKDEKQRAWVDEIRVIVPKFQKGGTHVNISGLALIKDSKNRAEAIRLAEWMVGAEAQAVYAAQNFEYPAVPGVAIDPLIRALGEVVPDSLPIETLSKQRKTASEIVDRVGFNQGPGS
jgi:iron(III) transport system substrate-binding protein